MALDFDGAEFLGIYSADRIAGPAYEQADHAAKTA